MRREGEEERTTGFLPKAEITCLSQTRGGGRGGRKENWREKKPQEQTLFKEAEEKDKLDFSSSFLADTNFSILLPSLPLPELCTILRCAIKGRDKRCRGGDEGQILKDIFSPPQLGNKSATVLLHSYFSWRVNQCRGQEKERERTNVSGDS